MIPCQELRSGKSLQLFFAGADLVRVNALKNIINHEYKLTNPDDPIRKRDIKAPEPLKLSIKATSPGYQPKIAKTDPESQTSQPSYYPQPF